jgi:hypothetical protein
MRYDDKMNLEFCKSQIPYIIYERIQKRFKNWHILSDILDIEGQRKLLERMWGKKEE